MGKKWFISRSVGMFFALTALSLLAGCTSPARHKVKPISIPPDEKILRVGVTANSPPLIYKQGNNIVGLEADLARELAKYLAKSPRFVELPWEDQIPALLENRIDIIMSGMTATTLREVRISFAIPYFQSGQMALIRRKDAPRFSTGLFSFATSSAIGVIKDTTGEYYVETQFSSVKRKTYTNPRAAVKDLINNDIDMFIYDAPTVLYLASENENKGLTVLFARLTKEPLAWGIRKGDVQLLESANNFLRSFNDEGQLSKMIKYWIPLAQ
ncbi:MAG: transporter substrate-binding domain-containing protein [Desulfobacterales bacterium]|nr:MAG: transporter substrate-binding domain-containing protein [Desulfobacterales bacterium]